jgi:hypothetical protein
MPRQPIVEGGLQSSNQYLRTPVVRYSSRMRINRLHPMKVTLTGLSGAVDTGRPQAGSMDPPIVVQVSVPGALVTPPHVIIPVSGGEAQFVVQPLMTGRLTGARVEFLSQGRKVSEVPLPMKVNRGYLAKFFLLLAILLPLLINFLPELVHNSKLPTKRPAVGMLENNRPDALQLSQTTPNIDVHATSVAASLILLQETPVKNEKTADIKKVEDIKKAEDVKKAEDSKKTEQKKGDEPKTESSKESTAQKDNLKDQPPPGKQIPGRRSYDSTEESLKTEKPEKTASFGSGGRPLVVQDGATGPATAPTLTVRPNQNATQKGDNLAGISYTGEDAIWAWARTRLEREGYRTELAQNAPSETNIPELLLVNKKYEIVKETSNEWSSSRLITMAIHYSESTLRLLYRLFIVFPRSWPFGDLIYGLGCLALAAIFWMYTGSNRRKIKGATMDIRFAGV